VDERDEDEMGRPCRTHGREEEHIEGFDRKSIKKETARNT
jgi:hypothetical protein